MSTHFCGRCWPLVLSLAPSPSHWSVRTRTLRTRPGRTCACAPWIRSQRWNAIAWQNGADCVKWVGGTQRSLVSITNAPTGARSSNGGAPRPRSLFSQTRVHVLCLWLTHTLFGVDRLQYRSQHMALAVCWCLFEHLSSKQASPFLFPGLPHTPDCFSCVLHS